MDVHHLAIQGRHHGFSRAAIGKFGHGATVVRPGVFPLVFLRVRAECGKCGRPAPLRPLKAAPQGAICIQIVFNSVYW